MSAEIAHAVVNLLEGVTQGGSGTRLRTRGADKYNQVYKEVVTGYPYEFTTLLPVKRELLKIKVTVGLWVWCRI